MRTHIDRSSGYLIQGPRLFRARSDLDDGTGYAHHTYAYTMKSELDAARSDFAEARTRHRQRAHRSALVDH